MTQITRICQKEAEIWQQTLLVANLLASLSPGDTAVCICLRLSEPLTHNLHFLRKELTLSLPLPPPPFHVSLCCPDGGGNSTHARWEKWHPHPNGEKFSYQDPQCFFQVSLSSSIVFSCPVLSCPLLSSPLLSSPLLSSPLLSSSVFHSLLLSHTLSTQLHCSCQTKHWKYLESCPFCISSRQCWCQEDHVGFFELCNLIDKIHAGVILYKRWAQLNTAFKRQRSAIDVIFYCIGI